MRKRPSVVVLFVLIAVGGFASTLALGSARGGILPTLSVPSLPVSLPVTTAPLPPAPPVPPVPPAPPPALPPAPVPVPKVPPAPPLQPVAHAASTSPAGAALPSVPPTSSGQAPSSASASASAPSTPHAATAPRVSRTRFHTRGPGRRGMTITFDLTAPATVVLLVRGPSPDCGLAGRRVVSLGRGVSRVRFLGRFHGRPLAPGTYGISMVARRGGTTTMLGRLAIAVVPPGERIQRSAARPAFAGCAPSSGAASGSSEPFAGLGLVVPAAARKVTGTADQPKASFLPPRLSALVPHVPALPGPPGGGPVWLGVLFYGVVLLAGGAILVLVLSFATERWNP